MTRDQIKKDLAEAVKKLGAEVGDVEVTRNDNPDFGDFSTNLALKISHGLSQSPMETAKILTDSLKNQSYVLKLEVKEPGFINFFLKPEVWQKQVADVLEQNQAYGSNKSGEGKKARVEFISANPTGPLHFGNARGGPIGDVLALILEFNGYEVLREYYHNDVGGQIEKLGESILNIQKGKKLEDQEYKGKYIEELAEKVGDVKSSQEAGKKAVELIFDEIKEDTRAMGIDFDEYYTESDLLKNGATQEVLEKVKRFLKEKDGAIWFAPSDEFLKDRETVVKKSDGSYTYFANDIAYHNIKFEGGADLVADVMGSNHHGHVPRLKAAISALGYDVSRFHVILYQWVRFKRGGKLVKMSKRSGTFVTAREVLDEIGPDALRFFILMHDANSPIDFDLDLASKKSRENPVYYVQYAHARIASIIDKATRLDSGQARMTGGGVDYELLTTNYELNLIRQIAKLPKLVDEISRSFAVHRLTAYAMELADSFHKFYENCPVISKDSDLQNARIDLVKSAKIALGNTLGLLGVSAPEKM
ncbi:MAG: arginine--tRNA ligase [Candidatus Curtissbacteria bacterium]|nr:arginine--tRNA ligase [Candidatus Curtissbacteria bacterium]